MFEEEDGVNIWEKFSWGRYLESAFRPGQHQGNWLAFHGQLVGQMDGWLDGWDGWVDRQMDRWMDRWMGNRLHG